jgi:hypothetical protein
MNPLDMIAAPHPRFPMQGKKKHLSCALESCTQYHKQTGIDA